MYSLLGYLLSTIFMIIYFAMVFWSTFVKPIDGRVLAVVALLIAITLALHS
jgi:hypothetical protein